MRKLFSFLLFFLYLVLNFSTNFAQNVGIGVPAPTQKLDVGGNVKFSGALMPAGNAGTQDQSLLSNGSGAAPYWGSATSGQQFNTVYSSSSIVLDKTTTVSTLIPGMTQSVVVPSTGTYDVWIYTDGGMQWTGNNSADNNGIQTEVSIWIDGSAARYTTVLLDNTNNFYNGIRNWSFCYGTTMSAGTHTVEVRAHVVAWTLSGKTEVTFASPNSVGNFLIGTLTVGLIKK